MPGHPRLSCASEEKTWMPGIADKFTQSAQRQTALAGHDEAASQSLSTNLPITDRIPAHELSKPRRGNRSDVGDLSNQRILGPSGRMDPLRDGRTPPRALR